MSEFEVKMMETIVPTATDEHGRPYCVCGCGEVTFLECQVAPLIEGMTSLINGDRRDGA